MLLNKFPYSSGHLMVAPLRHIAALGDLDPDEAAEIHSLTVQGIAALGSYSSPDGFNVGLESRCGRRRLDRRRTCTSTSSRAGAATRTSCRCSRTSRCCPSTWSRPGSGWRTPGCDPRASRKPERAPGPCGDFGRVGQWGSHQEQLEALVLRADGPGFSAARSEGGLMSIAEAAGLERALSPRASPRRTVPSRPTPSGRSSGSRRGSSR